MMFLLIGSPPPVKTMVPVTAKLIMSPSLAISECLTQRAGSVVIRVSYRNRRCERLGRK